MAIIGILKEYWIRLLWSNFPYYCFEHVWKSKGEKLKWFINLSFHRNTKYMSRYYSQKWNIDYFTMFNIHTDFEISMYQLLFYFIFKSTIPWNFGKDWRRIDIGWNSFCKRRLLSSALTTSLTLSPVSITKLTWGLANTWFPRMRQNNACSKKKVYSLLENYYFILAIFFYDSSLTSLTRILVCCFQN